MIAFKIPVAIMFCIWWTVVMIPLTMIGVTPGDAMIDGYTEAWSWATKRGSTGRSK